MLQSDTNPQISLIHNQNFFKFQPRPPDAAREATHGAHLDRAPLAGPGARRQYPPLGNALGWPVRVVAGRPHRHGFLVYRTVPVLCQEANRRGQEFVVSGGTHFHNQHLQRVISRFLKKIVGNYSV